MAAADDRPLLVCVYYRVAAADSARTISAVREFQRTLGEVVPRLEVEVLLRFDLPPAASAPHASPLPAPSPDLASDRATDVTLMETYRLPLPAPAGDAARAFLDTLATAARPVDGLLRSARHVELFAPCAS